MENELRNQWDRTVDEQQLWLAVVAHIWCEMPARDSGIEKMSFAITQAHEAVATYRKAMR